MHMNDSDPKFVAFGWIACWDGLRKVGGGKGEGMNHLNGRGVTCGSRKQKKQEHQEKITGSDGKKILGEC